MIVFIFSQDIEVCGLNSDVEMSRCDFTWDDDSMTTDFGCKELLYKPPRILDDTYCYLYASDTLFFGNSEMDIKGPWVKNIDFYFIIKDLAAATAHVVSVGTIGIQFMDPGNYAL